MNAAPQILPSHHVATARNLKAQDPADLSAAFAEVMAQGDEPVAVAWGGPAPNRLRGMQAAVEAGAEPSPEPDRDAEVVLPGVTDLEMLGSEILALGTLGPAILAPEISPPQPVADQPRAEALKAASVDHAKADAPHDGRSTMARHRHLSVLKSDFEVRFSLEVFDTARPSEATAEAAMPLSPRAAAPSTTPRTAPPDSVVEVSLPAIPLPLPVSVTPPTIRPRLAEAEPEESARADKFPESSSAVVPGRSGPPLKFESAERHAPTSGAPPESIIGDTAAPDAAAESRSISLPDVPNPVVPARAPSAATGPAPASGSETADPEPPAVADGAGDPPARMVATKATPLPEPANPKRAVQAESVPVEERHTQTGNVPPSRETPPPIENPNPTERARSVEQTNSVERADPAERAKPGGHLAAPQQAPPLTKAAQVAAERPPIAASPDLARPQGAAKEPVNLPLPALSVQRAVPSGPPDRNSPELRKNAEDSRPRIKVPAELPVSMAGAARIVFSRAAPLASPRPVVSTDLPTRVMLTSGTMHSALRQAVPDGPTLFSESGEGSTPVRDRSVAAPQAPAVRQDFERLIPSDFAQRSGPVVGDHVLATGRAPTGPVVRGSGPEVEAFAPPIEARSLAIPVSPAPADPEMPQSVPGRQAAADSVRPLEMPRNATAYPPMAHIAPRSGPLTSPKAPIPDVPVAAPPQAISARPKAQAGTPSARAEPVSTVPVSQALASKAPYEALEGEITPVSRAADLAPATVVSAANVPFHPEAIPEATDVPTQSFDAPIPPLTRPAQIATRQGAIASAQQPRRAASTPPPHRTTPVPVPPSAPEPIATARAAPLTSATLTTSIAALLPPGLATTAPAVERAALGAGRGQGAGPHRDMARTTGRAHEPASPAEPSGEVQGAAHPVAAKRAAGASRVPVPVPCDALPRIGHGTGGPVTPEPAVPVAAAPAPERAPRTDALPAAGQPAPLPTDAQPAASQPTVLHMVPAGFVPHLRHLGLATSSTDKASGRGDHALPPGFSSGLAHAVAGSGHSRAELILDPAELGRLRFDILTQGSQVQINLSAERPETLDLLRRHSEELRQEFQAAGFDTGTLNFGQWNQKGQDRAAPAMPPGAEMLSERQPALDLPAQPALRVGPPGAGLDLRL